LFHNYIFFLDCWNGEPEKRPFMYKVVERLRIIITQSNMTIYDYQNKSFDFDDINDQTSNALNSDDNLSNGELSQIIQNFDTVVADKTGSK